MKMETVIAGLAGLVPEENILVNEPMKKHTTFRIGGEAACYVKIQNADQLATVQKFLQQESVPMQVLGNGSNLLFSDEGFAGVILEICDKMNGIRVEGSQMIVQAGALMSKVARVAYENGLTGFEFAAGIPGTIGGGTVMNAGAYGGELKQVISSVKMLDETGKIVELSNEEMEFGYRTSIVKKKPYIVVEVTLQLRPGKQEEILEAMEDLAFRRRDKQPLEYPSAGSTFKRPEGYFAGELIMKSGLRGYRVGGAQVSEKHCGFVINTGDATAEDVLQLMEHVKNTVKATFGVELEPEVIVIK
jgi:UDP-N-acetylmuramate dehydrogenase